ncbi:hydrogenase maturation protein [Protofrankia coriariae]|uniref:Formyl transferase n=1 Tax=Protofrankia coriariae TaxID=1562887 RepID=A0ABR5F4M3_9ACTN|nr:hydrogenase maturation protein [Protofrankia coriariae]KLL11637.1 formyl transferase [Protofrankia coriariae]
MKILLLASAFNGLTQRAWIELRRAGHRVTVELALSAETMREAVQLSDPHLIICPFLRERVPDDIWTTRQTIIIHPGPVGDRGSSSLDWAILEGASTWGVTALQAVAEMDAGPIWSTREFAVPLGMSKSALYNGPVTDAAMAVIHDVVDKAQVVGFVPTPLDSIPAHRLRGRLRPSTRADDRRIDWDTDTTSDVLRKVAASDGSPGAPCLLFGEQLRAFDASPVVALPAARARDGERENTLLSRRDGAVLVPTVDGAVWIGHLRRAGQPKLPANLVVADHVQPLPVATSEAPDPDAGRDVRYHRHGPVGLISFDFYNGAMSTEHCRRLLAAFTWASQQDTRVIVLRGGDTFFSNGIHLNVIEAAERPATAAWANIDAMDDLCQAIITCTSQLVVAGISGSAGAGGVMLALGADLVAARTGVVLNPHYDNMGLYGSEYWTYTLPRRVGKDVAATLTTECLPVGDVEAAAMGLVDRLLPHGPSDYDDALLALADELAGEGWQEALDAKTSRLAADEAEMPLEVYRTRELSRMAVNFFTENRHADLRRAFVCKEKPTATPQNIALHRHSIAWRVDLQGASVTSGPTATIGAQPSELLTPTPST